MEGLRRWVKRWIPKVVAGAVAIVGLPLWVYFPMCESLSYGLSTAVDAPVVAEYIVFMMIFPARGVRIFANALSR
ncbi:MAG: hypothetical protein CEN90_44 [Parcubacteria group bacterium Licking1014_17]|nr:MAG: hypothetical protein CEN90_44 [Parcubacteria group bacterium Licking1014_17]